jgi:cell division protein FtsB
MISKLLKAIFICLIILFQYQIWFGETNIFTWLSLNRSIGNENKSLNESEEQIKVVRERLKDIKTSEQEFEAIARREHGLIKKNEVFVPYE